MVIEGIPHIFAAIIDDNLESLNIKFGLYFAILLRSSPICLKNIANDFGKLIPVLNFDTPPSEDHETSNGVALWHSNPCSFRKTEPS